MVSGTVDRFVGGVARMLLCRVVVNPFSRSGAYSTEKYSPVALLQLKSA